VTPGEPIGNIAWDFETIDFDSGAAVNMLVDNVVVTTHVPTTFASWMGGFTYPSGADTTPTGDADHDGISNLVQQVLGTAPNAATTGLTQVSASPGYRMDSIRHNLSTFRPSAAKIFFLRHRGCCAPLPFRMWCFDQPTPRNTQTQTTNHPS